MPFVKKLAGIVCVMASTEDLLQQTSLPKDKPWVQLQVEADEAFLSRSVSTCKSRQVLITAASIAGLMLMGVAASVFFNPSEERTDFKPGSATTAPYFPALAFIPTIPEARPVRSPQSVHTPHAPRMHAQHRRPFAFIPAVRPTHPAHAPWLHAPSRVPQLRMQSSVSSDQMEAFLKQPQPGFSWGEFNDRWNLQVQTYPPAQIQNIDMRQLLITWMGSTSQGDFNDSYQGFVLGCTQRPKSGVANMFNFLADWYCVVKPSGTGTVTRKYLTKHQSLEAVALLKLAPAPSGASAAEVRSGISAPFQKGKFATDDASVSALALFTREKLKDDSQGTLLKIVYAKFGVRATRDILFRRKKRIPVFSLKGLAMAPDSRFESAKALLAKILTWANIEGALVVVPKAVYSWPEAANPETPESALARWAFYEQLGFGWVAMDVGVVAPNGEDGGYYELVYMGAASSPSHAAQQALLSADSLLESTVLGTTYQEEVEHDQLMVRLTPQFSDRR